MLLGAKMMLKHCEARVLQRALANGHVTTAGAALLLTGAAVIILAGNGIVRSAAAAFDQSEEQVLLRGFPAGTLASGCRLRRSSSSRTAPHNSSSTILRSRTSTSIHSDLSLSRYRRSRFSLSGFRRHSRRPRTRRLAYSGLFSMPTCFFGSPRMVEAFHSPLRGEGISSSLSALASGLREEAGCLASWRSALSSAGIFGQVREWAFNHSNAESCSPISS
jgi:hypothetical protein